MTIFLMLSILGSWVVLTNVNEGSASQVALNMALAESFPAVKITELLPNPAAPQSDAKDEYIELYNPGAENVELEGYSLITGTTRTYEYTFTKTTLPAHSYLALYSSDTNLTLSNTSGQAKLLAPDGSPIDSTDVYNNAPDGQSWNLINGKWSWNKNFTPGAENKAAKKDGGGIDDKKRPPAKHSLPKKKNYPVVEISELLPNPAKPQTDAEGEFVELYNPNSKSVNLAGYKIVAGLKDSYNYVIKKATLAAHGYKAFYSGSTSLTLSNSAGHVKLFNPAGGGVDRSADYDKSGDGQAWIFADGKWQWTATPTPDKANEFSTPVVTSKKSFGQVKGLSTRGSGVSQPSASQTANGSYHPPPQSQPANLHPFVLAGVGSLAVLYALYEYRDDLANKLYKFRRHREARRTDGPPS